MKLTIPKKTLIIAGAWLVWNIVLWLVGTSAKVRVTPFGAFFGSSLINAIFYGGLKFVEKILAGSKPKP